MSRRNILSLVIVLALWFAGDRVGAFAVGRMLDHSNDPIAQLYGGRTTGDIVLLGNSRAYRHFDFNVLTKEFGGSVANLSLPGGSMELSVALLKDYIERYGAPRILIAELSQICADSEAFKNMRPFVSRSSRLSQLVEEHFPRQYRMGLVSHLFEYNSEYALNAMQKVFKPMPDLLLDGALGADAVAQVRPGTYFVPKLREVAAAKELVDVVRRWNIDARFVLTPVVPEYAAANQIAALRASAQQLTQGFRLWDLADTPPLDIGDFLDYGHLNRQGVKQFMYELRAHGFFASRHALEDQTAVKP